MLKRQRASSPFPQFPSISQDITSEGLFDVRDLKRRRVVSPLFDGQTRGWGAHRSNSKLTVEDYGEEESVEGKQHGRIQANFAHTEYAEVNNVLKEMHILHQHRQMFASFLLNNSQVNSPHLDKYHLSYRPEHQTLAEESARVYEHYEGTNR